ncbi:MAG: hypothetical protein CVV41_04570 [Candidatus Riflebacteria bacterium HGW-Riflebacteria-1]|nr:MAG: hypothetical protein CVV41_04570 [Candidatus Riflebacteria bacterium HGW-Riflebacteria-1]
MKKIAFLLLLVSMATLCLAAGMRQRIVLLDNSVIIGEVTEMKDGVYTVVSETVGEIKIAADKVLEISRLDTDQSSAPAKNIDILDRDNKKPAKRAVQPQSTSRTMASDDLKAQQERANAQVQSMAMQEDFLDNMMNLSGSGNMVEVMSDPEVMEAISRNDYEFLMNNEKMKNLMESSEIKDLFGE